MANSILTIKNLSKTYFSNAQPVHALKNISFSIQEGEIFGLLGVNGAGKTTLSSILATLHPATAGDVLYQGISIYENIYEYRRILGFCPQTQNLDPFLNVKENLIFAGRYYLMSEQNIKQRVQELMDQLELNKYADFEIEALSGGTKQRVLIGRALMPKPRIVIFDEPTVGLDPDIRKKLWQQIRDLKREGITVILTTHYLDEAEALSDRVCILHQGTIMLIESVSELKEKHKKEKLEDIFLDLVSQERLKQVE